MPIDLASASTEALSSDHLDRRLAAAAAVLSRAARVTVVCHENPDADTLGGGLALASSLDKRNVATEVICATAWPSTLDFLPGMDRVIRAPSQTPDAIVLVDCASVERAGEPIAAWIGASAAAIINVDHHVSNNRYGTVACIDHTAAATSEIVARLIRSLDVDIDASVASLLLAGVLHDTDGLRVEGTSPTTLRLVAELVDAGADIGGVSRQLFGQRPLSALRLWGGVMAGLESHLDGRLVIGTLRNDALQASGADLLDAEDLPDVIATARGADIALLLREIGPALVRVSIRTSTSVDASAVAAQFAGGGHERAAGCTIEGTVEDVRRRLVEACDRQLCSSEGRR